MKQNEKLTVIVGLGKTGFSVAKHLAKNGVNFALVDSRENPPCLDELKQQFPSVMVELGKFSAAILPRASTLIVSPGVSLKEPIIAQQIKNGTPAIGDIELFARAVRAPIIAITGSNGKSTVTTLVGEMAKACGLNVRVGGNLGTPALDLIETTEPDLYVLELSSFQLETTYSLAAAAAVILNIAPDHMDRYADLHEYAAAKVRIFNNCKCAIINREDEYLREHGVYARINAPMLSFGLNCAHENEFGVADGYLTFGAQKLLAINDLFIKGAHQVANALAALALGKAVNLPMSGMLQALRDFKGLAHRCQWTAEINGVDWYNDSKGTNVHSTLAAINGLGSSIKGKLILIAGGLGKGADFSLLGDAVLKHVRCVVLIGKDAAKIAAGLNKSSKIIYADSMEQAISVASKNAESGDAVLLSPACASFDMFKNFEHRGDEFMRLVRLLGNNLL
jgi:UDP-N-acetylmuramoylalanine--D-glutamate ligase